MLSIKEKVYWVWISRIPKVGTKTIQKLLKIYKTPEKIYNLTKQELINCKIQKQVIENILDKKYRNNLNEYINYMEKEKIDIITIMDKEYPQKLKQISDFPMYLYTKGNIKLLNKKSIAMVGSRNCTDYGKNVAKDIGRKLVENNIVVVSGLAKGIDTYSHLGALFGNESTIAVLGNSIDSIYPQENKWLAKEILNKNGLIISEYVMGAELKKINFPARNRIISGLSDGVLVIEAKEKSGALLTVDFALEQGREVFAIPGNIYSNFSKGTNGIIKEGAKLISNVDDILQEI